MCSEEETDLIIQGQDTAPSSTYLHDFIDGETDLLANSFFTRSKFQNREEETKNRRENTDVNDRFG